ncbi:MAG: winged helix-turn-helix transcriptional regulator [Shewanella sp.]
MEIHILHQQSISIRHIAEQLGISINTVHSYLRDKQKVPVYAERLSWPTKLQPNHDSLQSRIEGVKPY